MSSQVGANEDSFLISRAQLIEKLIIGLNWRHFSETIKSLHDKCKCTVPNHVTEQSEQKEVNEMNTIDIPEDCNNRKVKAGDLEWPLALSQK